MRVAVGLALLFACSFSAGQKAADATRGVDARATDAAAIDAPLADAPVAGSGGFTRTITIPGDHIAGGPHVEFPVLVVLAADQPFKMHAGSGDVGFTDAAGHVLPSEIEKLDVGGGNLAAWVQVPELVAGSDAIVELRYGEPLPTVGGMWGSGYVDVLHLDEPGKAYADSSPAGNGGSGSAGVKTGSGAIGPGVALDGMMGHVVVPRSDSLASTGPEMTVSAWFSLTNPDDPTKFQRFLTTSDRFPGSGSEAGYEWAVQDSGGDLYFYPFGGAADFESTTNTLVAKQWTYLAVTTDIATHAVALYIDGAPAPSFGASQSWTTAASPVDWLWGGESADNDTSGYIAGGMDEIHVATIARSGGWIATEYANQSDPGQFATIGEEH